MKNLGCLENFGFVKYIRLIKVMTHWVIFNTKKNNFPNDFPYCCDEFASIWSACVYLCDFRFHRIGIDQCRVITTIIDKLIILVKMLRFF